MSGGANKDAAFELDVDKLLAYFVIGSTAIDKDAWFFNSGVVDYDPSAKPGDKTKMKFDFKGPTSTYEICYMPKPTSKGGKGAVVNIGKKWDEIGAALNSVNGEESSIETPNDKLEKEKEEHAKTTKEEFNKQVTELIKDFEVKYRDGTAFNMLKAYLENFAGKDNAGKLKKTDIEICYLPKEYLDGPESPKVSYSDFKIKTVSGKDKIELAKKRFEEWQKSGGATVELEGLAFKIKVTMTILTK